MSADDYRKFSVLMPDDLYQQIADRIQRSSPGAEGRSSVISRDLNRLYNGLLKHGMKTLHSAAFSQEERTCLVTFLKSVLLWILTTFRCLST